MTDEIKNYITEFLEKSYPADMGYRSELISAREELNALSDGDNDGLFDLLICYLEDNIEGYQYVDTDEFDESLAELCKEHIEYLEEKFDGEDDVEDTYYNSDSNWDSEDEWN